MFLVRMTSLPEGQNFIWKGGSLVLRAYRALEIPRFTVDIDLMIQGHTIEKTTEIFETACKIDLDDGFAYRKITIDQIQRDTSYGGYRYNIEWTYEGNPGPQDLKIDVCTGDVVEDETRQLKDTTFFVKEECYIRVYPVEYIFAEKLETLFKFAKGNTRLKDFIDLWSFTKLDIEQEKLIAAIHACFNKRGRKFELDSLTEIFRDEGLHHILNTQMSKYYIKRLKLPSLNEILDDLKEYLLGLPL